MRGKSLVVMNVEISQYGDFREGSICENVFHFASEMVKDFWVVSSIREKQLINI